MEALAWVYFVGLGAFVFNSIVWMGQRNERVLARVREEKLKDLLVRAKLRNRRRY